MIQWQSNRVLVACEFSGRVRDAFRACGLDAYSCDLLPSEAGEPHLQCDVRDVLDASWDLLIAHPPCTHLAVSGARYFAIKEREQAEALDFVRLLLEAPIPRIALENPVSIISTKIREPDQIVQPWLFGHEESKATCLWLKNLPPLKPVDIVTRHDRNLTPSGQNRLSPSPDRWKLRSLTYPGIAAAMAQQWAPLIGEPVPPEPEQLVLF